MVSNANNQKQRRPRRSQAPREKEEFEQKLIEIRRVTRVMAGGKRMRFRACVVIGDRKGRVSYGIGKGPDVTIAIQKAITRAKKRVIHVPIVNDTIPHDVFHKFSAAKILIKPAPRGTGVKAGGAVRIVLDYAGVQNVVAKILGTNNKMNNVKATYDALKSMKTKKEKKEKKAEKKSDK